MQVIAVSPDDPDLSRSLVAELALPFPILSDPSGRVATGVGAVADDDVLPSALVLDASGRPRWWAMGRGPADQPPMGGVMAAVSGRGRLSVPAPSDVLTPTVATLIALVATLLGILAAVAHRELLWWDVPVRDLVVSNADEGLGRLFRRSSVFGSRWLIAALSLPMIAIAWRRCRQLAVVLGAAFAVALGLELVLKVAVDRPRPEGANGFGSSFPSGHVLAAVAFWGLLAPWTYIVVRRRWAWAAAVVGAGVAIVLVGLNRVTVGAHWPSDVVGSLLAGGMLLLGAEWVLRRSWRRFDCPPCQLHALRPSGASPGEDAGRTPDERDPVSEFKEVAR